MNPIFDLFGRILVHNSSIQCFSLRGNQETESCVCMVPGPRHSLNPGHRRVGVCSGLLFAMEVTVGTESTFTKTPWTWHRFYY